MSEPVQVLKVLETHKIKCHLGLDREGMRGGLIVNSEYVWFTNGADIVLYSTTTGCVESSRSFGGDAQTDNSIKITFVQELHKSEETMNMLLVGCSCKSFGILFVCQLPTLTVIRCIDLPSPISYISTINNESLAQDQLCDEFNIMSTVLLVGMITGAVYAVDLRKRHIENQLRRNEIVVNESRPSKLFIIRKNEDCQKVKEMSDHSDIHLAMFINESICKHYKTQWSGKLNFNISCLLYTEEINAVAIGYITGHFQLWDCKIMQTLYVFKKPECSMPITHITFLEQADDPNNLCYLWIIQSDNSRLPNAIMIALSFEHRTMLSNGRSSYRVYKECNIKLKMLLSRESGIGRCISALTLCNDTLVSKSIGVSQNCGITLFAMLMEIRQDVDTSPKSYFFLFDINQWYKAQMPSFINHLKVSNSYASFVKLPDYASYLDFNISNKTLRPIGSYFRNNSKKLYYPSSIYFECDCLLDTKVIKFKHVGVQQEVLDKLILNSWRLFVNPSLIFCQCLKTNLRPFFWDKSYDYKNYTLLDKFHFVISVMVENNIMSVFDDYAEKWKNGTDNEVIVLHLVECLWNHVMLVKQYADQLCVPLFDCSGTLVGKKNVRMLNDCLSQMQSVENIFRRMQFTDCIQIINVDLVNRVKIINLVTQYFNAIIYFFNFQLLPKQIEEDSTRQIIQCNFTSLIQYASTRRMEFGNLPLYLIDAIVTNEPNGNKLIKQWKHDSIEETKGLYPPTNVQCLLRIYLNAELSNQVKDFITIYFLIDVCSVQKMNEITANIFNDNFVKNEELFKLCCASWLLDHDMFEDAMLILASNNQWMINDKSWNWYHWTVLKLFVFKKQYYWAQIYFELFDIKLVNLDDHKFYVNLQILNNHCFDALYHLNLRKTEDKKILFEYIFDRCRHTNQLKSFLSYPLDSDEKKLFFSCLKKFEDTELIQFMFLVQENRYSEASELRKSLKIKTNSKHDYILTIASALVGKIKDNVSSNNKRDLKRKVFSNTEIKMKFMNCCMDNHINMNKSNIFRSYGESCQINLIVPDDDKVDRIQGLGDKVLTINGELSPSKTETVIQIENKLLRLLDTPFIQNISTLPSVTNSLAVPKKKSATDNELLSTIKLDKMSQTLTLNLPDNNAINVEKFSHKAGMSMKNIIPKDENLKNSDTNKLPINMITEQSPITFHKLLKDNSKIKLLETLPITYTVDREEYEKMDTSDNDQSVIPDGEYKDYFEELNVMLEGGKNEYVEKPVIILDETNNINNSEPPYDLLDEGVSVENYLDETSILPDCENVDNLEEPDILDDANDYNKLEQPDAILKGDSDENLEESDVIPHVEDEDNFKEPYFILEGENYECLEEPDIIIDNSNDTNNSEQPDDLLGDDVGVENHFDQLSVIHGENEDNLGESDVILDNANDCNKLEQPVILKGDIDENLEESDVIPHVEDEDNFKEPCFILEGENYECVETPDIILDNSNDTNNSEQPDDILDDDISVENFSDQLSVLSDGENEDNLEEPDVILDDANDTNNSEQPDDILDDDISVENYSNQLSVISDGENEDNLEELDVIFEDENYEYVEEPDIILNDSNDTNNSEHPDGLLGDDVSVEHYSNQLSVIPDCENEDILDESDVIHGGEKYEYEVEEPGIIILEDLNYTNNSEPPDDFLGDDVGIKNHSDQLSVIPDGENEDNLGESDVILDNSNNTNNLEQPDDLLGDDVSVVHHSSQLSVIHEGENEDSLDESDVIHGGEKYEYEVEEPGIIILDDLNYTNNSEPPEDFLGDDVGIKNHSDQLSVIPDGENEDNLGESDVILDNSNNTNNLEQPDDLLGDDVSVVHHSSQQSVIHEGENEDSLDESDVIHGGEKYEYEVEEPGIIILDDLNYTNNSEPPEDFLGDDVGIKNHSDQLSVIPDGENEDNLGESDVILDNSNNTNNLEQPDDLLGDDVSVVHHSSQQSVIHEGENEDSLDESDVIHGGEKYEYEVEEPGIIILDELNYTNNSEPPDDFLGDDVGIKNHSDQLSVIPDGENEDNLGESDVILDNSNNTNNLEQPDDLLGDDVSVVHHSSQLSVIHEGENEDSLEEPDVLPDSENKENSEETYASEQNITQLFETLKSENTPENNVIVDRDNVIYPIESNQLENLAPCFYGFTEENCSNFDSQIIEKKNENYLCNIVDGNQTPVVIKEDDIAEVVENTDKDNKPSTPINFQIIENPKEDLCNDQNEDYLYDEYQFSNNYIYSEMSNIEFNPIPEYGFNHLTMTGNETTQLEMYDTLNQQTSVLLNESFLNNISLGTTVDVIESRDSVVDKNVEIIIDEVSEDVKPSSSNTTINTNLYNIELKSYQLVEYKDIASQLVDSKILNSANKDYAIEIQSSCLSAASEPSKTLIIEETLPNSMLHKDIFIQEETSKLVKVINSYSDTVSAKTSAENVHNLSINENNEQPLIEQKIKNIPNLRKRKYGTKCVPRSNTKLTTKSRSENKTKQVELKIISSINSSPTSEIVEDCLMSKKRSKRQKKIAPKKRRMVCPKYVASIDRASNSKIDLEQISGESTANEDTNIKKIEELLPNNLPNKDTESLEELTKLIMPIEVKLEAENNDKILNQNIISDIYTNTFFLEPKVILKRFDVSSYKNRFNLLKMANDKRHESLSTNETHSQKPIALKRLRKGCLKSMKEPTAINTIIDLDELKEDSINNDKNKAVTRKSKLNSSNKIKKVELDKNLKSSADRRVVTLSMPNPINCVNKIHNSLIEETIHLISDDEFVSDIVQEEMGKINSDEEKLDWRIISNEVKTNTNAIPKIRLGRNKRELNTVYVGSQLDFNTIKRDSKFVLEQEPGLIKKSNETKILNFKQQVCRRSSRKILKRQKCSCCINKSMDVVCSSNVL